ncbi:MAG: YtxH domain-containing protein [Thermonemataceae bacterium]
MNDDKKQIIKASLQSLAVGLIIGLLMAPKKGRKTRRNLLSKGKQLLNVSREAHKRVKLITLEVPEKTTPTREEAEWTDVLTTVYTFFKYPVSFIRHRFSEIGGFVKHKVKTFQFRSMATIVSLVIFILFLAFLGVGAALGINQWAENRYVGFLVMSSVFLIGGLCFYRYALDRKE